MIRVLNKDDKYIDSVVSLRIKLNDMHTNSLPSVFKDHIELPTYEDTIDAISNEYRDIIIYEENNNLFGLAVVSYNQYNETYDRYSKRIYSIDELMVSPDFQNKGIGKKIIDFIKHDAIEKGFTIIELDVYSFNEKAIKFYQNVGFKNAKLVMSMENDDE